MTIPARRLLALAGVRAHAPAPIQQIPPAAWAGLIQQAEAARLAGLIAAQLDRHGEWEYLPRAGRQQLRAAQKRNLIEYYRQAYALARLSTALQEAGIAFRLLKGLALAAYYPDPTARDSGDLDIWVPPASVDRAIAVITRLGLHQRQGEPQPIPFLRAYDKELTFVPGAQAEVPAIVDLHWHLTSPWWVRQTLTVPEAQIFARPAWVEINQQAYPTLNPTDQLFYLCLNASLGDQFTSLRSLGDMARLLESGAIAWNHLTRLAEQAGAQIIVGCCLELLDSVLDTTYTEHLTQRQPITGMQRHLVRRLVAQPWRAGTDRPPAGRTRMQQLLLLPGPRAMGQGLGRMIWPPDEWIRLRYNLGIHNRLIPARLRHLMHIPV